MRVLTINPGSTSTKIAVYDESSRLFVSNIKHDVDDLAHFGSVNEQFEFRRNLVVKTLRENGYELDFDAVVGRGGLLKPIPGGVYEINDVMLGEMERPLRQHACNLGCLIANDIAAGIPECRALIADPGVVDELDDVARITGSPIMPRITTWHALNQRAIGRRHASELNDGRRYEDLNLIICHLGGGISIGAHLKGRCIDVNNALDGDGPFSPERAGTLPAGVLIDLCYSGRYTVDELKKRISGKAGLAAHLGTTDVQAVVKAIETGDTKAKLVLDAMNYQIAKSIGGAAVALRGEVDGILLTGGIAYSEYVTEQVKARVEFIAPVYVYPGEDEMLALALNGIGALRGEIPIKEYR